MIKTLIGLGLAIALAYGAYVISQDRGWKTSSASRDGLTRSFDGKELLSPETAKAALSFDGFDYKGGQQFILYGSAQVEQHVFVRPASEKAPYAVMVVQFEEVLPGLEWEYDYSAAPETREISGLTFHVDQRPGEIHWFWKKGRPGSDGYRARQFLADEGIAVPDPHIWSRWAYVPGDAQSREMLLLINEALPEGETSPDLEAVAARMEAAIRIRPLG